MQNRRAKKVAKRFFRKLLKGLEYVPRVTITDKLSSYAAAEREILPDAEHRKHEGLTNRAEPPPSINQAEYRATLHDRFQIWKGKRVVDRR